VKIVIFCPVYHIFLQFMKEISCPWSTHQTLAGSQNIISLRKIWDLSKKFLLRKIHRHIHFLKNVNNHVISVEYFVFYETNDDLNEYFPIFIIFGHSIRCWQDLKIYYACKQSETCPKKFCSTKITAICKFSKNIRNVTFSWYIVQFIVWNDNLIAFF